MSTEQMETICKRFIPHNMKKSRNWAVKVFKQWQVEGNEAASSDDKLYPENLLECHVPSYFNYWLMLSWYIEARRAGGQSYPAI